MFLLYLCEQLQTKLCGRKTWLVARIGYEGLEGLIELESRSQASSGSCQRS